MPLPHSADVDSHLQAIGEGLSDRRYQYPKPYLFKEPS